MKIDFANLPEVVAIVGSRSFAKSTPDTARAAADCITKFVNKLNKGTIVTSGEAIGADRYARDAAKRRYPDLGYEPFFPDETIPMPKRFFDRNTELVEWVEANDGVIVAFTDINAWNGTKDTIRKAVASDVPYINFQFTIPPFKHHSTDATHFFGYVLEE